MADKQVKVTLRAEVANYLKGMQQAAAATNELAESSDDVAAKNARWEQSANLVGGQMLVMGGAVAAGIGLAINAYASFDEAMSAVQAATHASASDMELLTAAARDAGASTAYSATEAAGAIEELSKAGVSTADILSGGLTGALDLAAAGELGVADAAEIAASAMTQFGLRGDEVSHVADVLAAGAGKAQGSVQDMANALQYAGVPAAALGISIEETSGAIALLASNGIMGEQAGTSLRSMLLSLSAPTKVAAAAMSEYGINVYDASGNFIGLEATAGVLQDRLGGLSQEQQQMALSQMFGNESISAGIAIMKAGADGVREWTDAVNDSGYAAETAALMQDNLRGDIEKLGGAWDDLMIGMGQSADAPMRVLVQGLTNTLDLIGSAPAPVQALMMGLAGLTSAGLLAGGTFLTLVPKIAETKAAMDVLGISTDALKGTLAGFKPNWTLLLNPTLVMAMAGAVMVGAAAWSVYQEKQKQAESEARELAAAVESVADGVELLQLAGSRSGGTSIIPALSAAQIEQTKNQLGDLSTLLDKLIEQDKGFNLGLEIDLDTNWFNATGAIRDMGDELALLAETDIGGVSKILNQLATEYDISAEAMWQFIDESPAFVAALHDQALAAGAPVGSLSTLEEKLALVEWIMGDTKGSSTELADGMTEIDAAAEEAAAGVESLSDAIRAYDDLLTGLLNAEMGYYQALDDVAEALGENAHTLDLTTQAGRDNMSALLDLSTATNDWAADVASASGNAEEVAAIIADGKQAWIDNAVAMGMNADEAANYAEQLFMTPDEVMTEVVLNTGTTEDELQLIYDQLNSLEGDERHIFLDALTEDARNKLSELGFDVTQLSDGRWRVYMDGDTELAQAEMDALLEYITGQSASTQIGADTTDAYTEVSAFIEDTFGQNARANVGADVSEAEGEVVAWKLQTDGTWAVSHMDAEKAKADSSVIVWKQNADGTWATAHMGAEAAKAYNAKDNFVRNTNGTWAAVKVNADTSAAKAGIDALNGRTVTIGVYEKVIGKLATGGLVEHAANGLMNPRSTVASGIYPGGADIVHFAEPETRWEAYISGKRGLEERNIGIGFEALRRLGATWEDAMHHLGGSRVSYHADGGVRDYSLVRAARASSVGNSYTTITTGIEPGSSLLLQIGAHQFDAVVKAAAAPVAAAAATSAVRGYDRDGSMRSAHGRQKGR